MKKPILAIGIIMFGLFIYQVSRDQKWSIFQNDKYHATSCKGVLIRLEKLVPNTWKVYCEGNNFAVEIQETLIPENATNLKSIMYRQLANHMSFVARSSHSDILEKVFFVRFKINHPRMVINAVTEGKFIVKLATLETPEHIMAHLKSTVQVKEDMK